MDNYYVRQAIALYFTRTVLLYLNTIHLVYRYLVQLHDCLSHTVLKNLGSQSFLRKEGFINVSLISKII